MGSVRNSTRFGFEMDGEMEEIYNLAADVDSTIHLRAKVDEGDRLESIKEVLKKAEETAVVLPDSWTECKPAIEGRQDIDVLRSITEGDRSIMDYRRTTVSDRSEEEVAGLLAEMKRHESTEGQSFEEYPEQPPTKTLEDLKGIQAEICTIQGNVKSEFNADMASIQECGEQVGLMQPDETLAETTETLTADLMACNAKLEAFEDPTLSGRRVLERVRPIESGPVPRGMPRDEVEREIMQLNKAIYEEREELVLSALDQRKEVRSKNACMSHLETMRSWEYLGGTYPEACEKVRAKLPGAEEIKEMHEESLSEAKRQKAANRQRVVDLQDHLKADIQEIEFHKKKLLEGLIRHNDHRIELNCEKRNFQMLQARCERLEHDFREVQSVFEEVSSTVESLDLEVAEMQEKVQTAAKQTAAANCQAMKDEILKLGENIQDDECYLAKLVGDANKTIDYCGQRLRELADIMEQSWDELTPERARALVTEQENLQELREEVEAHLATTQAKQNAVSADSELVWEAPKHFPDLQTDLDQVGEDSKNKADKALCAFKNPNIPEKTDLGRMQAAAAQGSAPPAAGNELALALQNGQFQDLLKLVQDLQTKVGHLEADNAELRERDRRQQHQAMPDAQ